VSEPPTDLAALAERHALVLHVESGTVGRVVVLFPAGVYVPASEGEDAPQALDEAVVQLDGGDAFLAREGAFLALSDVEGEVLGTVQARLREMVAGAAVLLARGGSTREAAQAVVRAALAAQLRALR
jgi:hypothetical protein